MREFLQDLAVTLKTLGPSGLFILSVLDSIGVPLPAFVDAVVIGAGVASAKDPYYAWLMAAMAVLGSSAGNAFLFLGARRGSRLWSKGETDVPPGKRQKMRGWFQQYGLMTVFIPAVVPVLPLPLKVFVIIAGVMQTPFWKFMAVILVSRLVRYLGLAWLGLQLGADAEGFLYRNAWGLTGAAVAMAGGLYWLMGRKATPPAS